MPQSIIEEFQIGKEDCPMKAIGWAGCMGLILASCSNHDPLAVKQFTVRDTDPGWSEDLMVRGEIQKRLYGAVEQEDREKRKGQYYSVRWRANPVGGLVQIRFQYRQAATASKVLAVTQTVPADEGTGVVEFSVAGDSYRKGGRVLAWRMTLSQGGNLLGEEKSFLWE
ncbi:hypothetical protein [Roseibacillus persicicus]|nr:hypothetical protein [Roseibacillus persicicus]